MTISERLNTPNGEQNSNRAVDRSKQSETCGCTTKLNLSSGKERTDRTVLFGINRKAQKLMFDRSMMLNMAELRKIEMMSKLRKYR